MALHSIMVESLKQLPATARLINCKCDSVCLDSVINNHYLLVLCCSKVTFVETRELSVFVFKCFQIPDALQTNV